MKLGDKDYHVSGATRRKARTFLLKAAEYAEIPLSKLLTAKGPRGPRKPGGSKKTATSDKPANSNNDKKDGDENDPAANSTSGETKSITLSGGSKLTLSLNVTFMQLPKIDRDFVSILIDKLEGHENPAKPETGEGVKL